MDAVRLFPLPDASSGPILSIRNDRLHAKHLAEYHAYLAYKRAEAKMQDLEFELYQKSARQNTIRLEIFTLRKVDLYV